MIYQGSLDGFSGSAGQPHAFVDAFINDRHQLVHEFVVGGFGDGAVEGLLYLSTVFLTADSLFNFPAQGKDALDFFFGGTQGSVKGGLWLKNQAHFVQIPCVYFSGGKGGQFLGLGKRKILPDKSAAAAPDF